jgi:hypothetical protein
MLTLVTPHLQLDSILELDGARLRALGLAGLLLDVDGTLKDYYAAEFRAEVQAWVRALRAGGIRLCLLSNGKARRIGRLAQQLEVPFVAQAFKPLPFACRAALHRLGLDRTQTALAGDQLFADVLAGRLAGLFTILVRPTTWAEPWFTRLKRPLERQVLRWMKPPAFPSPADKV